MINETLHSYVDAWVIRYLFGKDAVPLAEVRVLLGARKTSELDLRVDQFLLQAGASLPIETTLARYGRTQPRPGAPSLSFAHRAPGGVPLTGVPSAPNSSY